MPDNSYAIILKQADIIDLINRRAAPDLTVPQSASVVFRNIHKGQEGDLALDDQDFVVVTWGEPAT